MADRTWNASLTARALAPDPDPVAEANRARHQAQMRAELDVLYAALDRSAPRPADELADLRSRRDRVLAYLDQRAGTPGAGPTVPADLIRAMLTEETPA